MFYECKVYDRKGKLTKIHSPEEIKARSRKECLAIIDSEIRERIIRFDEARLPTG